MCPKSGLNIDALTKFSEPNQTRQRDQDKLKLEGAREKPIEVIGTDWGMYYVIFNFGVLS